MFARPFIGFLLLICCAFSTASPVPRIRRQMMNGNSGYGGYGMQQQGYSGNQMSNGYIPGNPMYPYNNGLGLDPDYVNPDYWNPNQHDPEAFWRPGRK